MEQKFFSNFTERLPIDQFSFLLMGVLWPAWWLVVRYVDKSAFDPLSLRLIVGAIGLSFFILNMVSGSFRKYAQSAVLFCALLVTANLLFVCERNGFAGIYFLGPLIALVCLYYILAFTKYLRVFAITSGLALLVLVVADTNTNKFIVFAGNVTIAIVMLSIQRSKTILINEILATREHLARILDHLPVGVLFQEDDHSYVNAEIVKILQLAPDEKTPEKISEKLRHAVPIGFSEFADESEPPDQFSWRKYKFVDKAGQLRYFDCKTLADQSRQMIVITDETRITKMQQRVTNMQKMSSLGMLAGGIAHEINNPLAIIRGCMETLQLRPDLSPESLSLVHKAISTTEHAADIIQGLLIFAREKEGAELQNITVRDVIDQTFNFCRQRLERRDIDVQVKGEIDAEIRANLVSSSQCLLNLIANATDSLENCPQKRIVIAAEVHDKEVVVSVEDSGTGIPDDVAARIMEPFFTTKGVGRGSGLGLSISQGLMASQGGRLEYVPQAAGCRFELVFQRVEASH